MSDKQAVLEVVAKLPETVSLEQIRNELALLESLREGFADSQAGRVIAHNEVKQRFSAWPSK